MDIIKYFIDKNCFVRVISNKNKIIIWNDYDILIKLKLEDILKYKATILDECCIKIMNQIEIKYKINNRKISVIIPNYNNEAHIKKTVLSILNNTYKNLEVVVVDDCSTDESMNILLENFGNNGRVKIYSTQINSGTYYCRNLGILMSSGYYIGFVDGDDYVLPEKYDYEVKRLEELNKDKILYWGYGTGFNRIYYEDNIDNVIEIKKSNYYNYIFYRKLYNRIGYYHDNRFGADSEFIKRLGIYGYKVYQDKQAVFYNAYTTIGKNLTQIYSADVRREYIKQRVETIRTKNYIIMALLDCNNFIRDIKNYKNNQLKYIKKKEISTQTDNKIVFEELYHQIISKIENEYILKKRFDEEQEQDNEQEQEPEQEQDNEQEPEQEQDNEQEQEPEQEQEQDNEQEQEQEQEQDQEETE
jgi:glycosyltransferase involved in cell wall biosynthesis